MNKRTKEEEEEEEIETLKQNTELETSGVVFRRLQIAHMD